MINPISSQHISELGVMSYTVKELEPMILFPVRVSLVH